MTGQKLLIALGRTTSQIDLLRDGYENVKVTPAEARAMAATGLYEGGGMKRCVKFIRLAPPAVKSLPWVNCWRTTQAAVFYPSASYWESVRS